MADIKSAGEKLARSSELDPGSWTARLSFGHRGVKETPVPASRNKYKPDFKAKVALEALKGDKSTAELAQIYKVHPAQITARKKQLIEGAGSVFEGRGTKSDDDSVDVDALYRKIGQLEVERDF